MKITSIYSIYEETMSESEKNYRENNEMEEDEEMEEEESDDAEDDEESTEDQRTGRVHLPDQPLQDGEELVMDDQAYLVYHQVCIFGCDTLNDLRTLLSGLSQIC